MWHGVCGGSDMIFLTVGTQFPFDRLVRAVDEEIGRNSFSEEVVAQVGETSYRPRNLRAVASMGKQEFDRCFRESCAVIGHAGMGTISMALELEKPLLVLPRRRSFREVVNDHQVAIAHKFEQLGHVLVAYETEDLSDKMKVLREFKPRPRRVQPEAVTRRIAEFLSQLCVQW